MKLPPCVLVSESAMAIECNPTRRIRKSLCTAHADHATRCQDSSSQYVGMAECQDSSQLRVTYITNDCGPVEQERRTEIKRRRARRNGAIAAAPECARARSVGGLMLRASHRLSSRRYADPAARLPYFNASVIGSPPATGILKASPRDPTIVHLYCESGLSRFAHSTL